MSVQIAAVSGVERPSLSRAVRRMSLSRAWTGATVAEGGRWISLFFFLAGVLALFQAGLARSTSASVLLGLAAVSLLAGTVGWLLPWNRWKEKGLRWVPPTTCGFIALAFAAGANAAVMAGLFVLLAVWIGLFQPPSSGMRSAPWILAAYAGPLFVRGDIEMLLRSTATTVIVSVVVAEVISRIILALESSRGEAERVATIFHATSLASRRMKTVNPDGVYRELVDATLAVGFEAAAINVVDRAAGRFVVRTSSGFLGDVNAFAQTLSEGLSGRVLASRSVTISDDYGNASYRLRHLDPDGFQVVAGIPVEIKGEVVAVLVACSRERLELRPYALDALELLTSDAAVALENALAFQHQRDLANELGEHALRDSLTGLGNRRAADAELLTMSEGDYVVMIDLDHFKEVNDTDGHVAGDAVLARVGQFLRTSLRTHDFAARWGGEEFLVIFRGAGEEGSAIADRLLSQWRAGRPRTTFSVGVAIHRAGSAPVDTLQIADAGLYRAKRLGRDRVVATRLAAA